MDTSVETQYRRPIPPTNGTATRFVQADQLPQPVIEEGSTDDMLGRIARLEATTGAALAVLRSCIVEEKRPTREALAAEAGFVFGMPDQAAMAELDEVAQMVGISSLR